MALHKFSKSKTFHIDYCGCTAATSLLNDQTIRDAIGFIRQVKTKRDFVKTTVTITRDGIKIIYNNEQHFSTIVPSAMIAGSDMGKPPLHNTVGVVYISPLTGDHYPAFVHVYRCDTPHIAQKFLSRLRSYLLIESHRLHIIQLEKQLLERNLLNIDQFNSRKSHQTNTGISSSSTTTNSNNREENKIDPIKSITNEFQKKIDSNEPMLFPPKDYDTLHTGHGNIQRAQAWKSTEPAIVGYSPIDPDDHRTRQYLPRNAFSTTDKHRHNDVTENNNAKSRLSTHQNDAIVDPVETVSLAFDFLKDETSSIFTENDGNVQHLPVQQQNKSPVYRFRPPQITAITKKIFSRNSNYEVTNGVPQLNSSLRNDLDTPHNNKNHNNNNNNNNNRIQNGHRTRSETHLHYDQQPNMHLSSRYESRLVNGSGAPITTNPLWTAPSPSTAGSQPNLLSNQSPVDLTPRHHQLSPRIDRRIPSTPLQHPLYASYPDNKPEMITKQQGNQQKRSAPGQHQSSKKQTTQSQYLDTNEFILRASNGQPLRNAQHPNRHVSKEYRPHSMNANGTMLDVYY